MFVIGAAWLAGCEIEKVAIPRTDKRVALHGVLSATATSQVVLLERTRNGSVYLSAPSFDLEDPLGSDAGIAESGAVVTLTTPSGQTLVAREDKASRNDGTGAGVYRFTLPGNSLVRSGAYRLAVRTTDGALLAAETSVPGGTPAAVAAPRVFDRSRDTMVVEWPAALGARSYFVRIETPYGPRSFFTDSTRVRLTGDLRNVELDALPRVFIPGFPQAITVSAVDSNYYDWFRTHNDALSGTGLINRVSGGLGVFGSLVRIRFQDVSVVATQTEAVAGTFKFVGVPAEVTPYPGITLYVESRAARSDQPDALSGRYENGTTLAHPGCTVCGLLGSVKNNRVELAFLKDWSARDTVEILTGELRGDTIVGAYRGYGGVVHFVRQR